MYYIRTHAAWLGTSTNLWLPVSFIPSLVSCVGSHLLIEVLWKSLAAIFVLSRFFLNRTRLYEIYYCKFYTFHTPLWYVGACGKSSIYCSILKLAARSNKQNWLLLSSTSYTLTSTLEQTQLTSQLLLNANVNTGRSQQIPVITKLQLKWRNSQKTAWILYNCQLGRQQNS